MTSRGKTAPNSPSYQPKQSRAQTRPSRSEANGRSSGRDQRTRASRRGDTRASRRQQTRAGRSDDTRGSRRHETRGVSRRQDTSATRRTLKTEAGERDGNKSLFSRSRDGKSGAAGEKVRTDDVWNKFVDEKVRAPTARSRQSQARTASDGETRTYDSEYDSYDSEDSYDDDDETVDDDEYDENDEYDDDDARTIYSNYYLDGYEYYEPRGPPEPRAEILDPGKTHDVCSCYPNRSDKSKGSMLYDKITCKHKGDLKGHTHEGVYKFNPYWNENMEVPKKLRKSEMSYPKMTFVFGYPKPRFEQWSESEDDASERSSDGTEMTHDRGRRTHGSGRSYDSRDNSTDDDYSDYDSRDDDVSDYRSDDDDDEDHDYVPFTLPTIGYPKTPSLPRSSQSFRSQFSDVPDSLPEVPGSRQLTGMRTAGSQRRMTTQRSEKTRQETRKSVRTAKTSTATKTAKTSKSRRKTARFSDSDDDSFDSRRRGVSRQSLPKGPVINTERTYQGKYYDPATKQVMLFDIKKETDKRLPNGVIEPLYKPPPLTAQKQTDIAGAKQANEISKQPGEEQRKPAATKFKAAVLGKVFISNMLKSVRKKEPRK